MIGSAILALRDLLSREFRSVLVRAVGLTFGLFVGLLAVTEILVAKLAQLPWPWAETIVAVGSGLALLAAFFFLMAPVTAIFAGLFLDEVAAVVEARHYPDDPPGAALGTTRSVIVALQVAAVVFVVNIAILPLVLLGVGAFVLVVANAYLISREYFEMAASRHLPLAEARQLRKNLSPQVLAAGFLPALASLVPVLNLAVPLFATAYFVHIFKKVAPSSM